MKIKSKYIFRLLIYFGCFGMLVSINACKKIVQISEPINSITGSKTFNSDASATAAVLAIYSHMSFGANSPYFANGGMSIYSGLSADELIAALRNDDNVQFETNKLLVTSGIPGAYFWQPAYFDIYMANAVIEGLEESSGVSVSAKAQLIGEAKFLRAFCYFYLTNLFGDVPLNLTSDWNKTRLMTRTSQAQVYQQIIQDLKDAKAVLIDDYSLSQGERIRANKWAAAGLLARVYLYTQEWSKSEEEATLVINNSLRYSLVTDLSTVFLKNSNEAILQLQIVNTQSYATREGQVFIPFYLTRDFSPDIVAQVPHAFVPDYYLSDQLLNSFESGDQRKNKWTDTTGMLNGKNYYYPFKYKIKKSTAGNITEYNTLLRLSELYLIRSESKAQQNKISEAQSDLNAIRTRAGLANTTANDKNSLLMAILNERQNEFFAEWGHRWLDLKRTQQANSVLGSISTKQPWSSHQLFFPIPVTEMQRDHNLTQNVGY